MTTAETNTRIPSPSPASLLANETAILVLDLTAHAPAAQKRQAYLDNMATFLQRAREAEVAICYTGISLRPNDPVDPTLKRRPEEPLWYPEAYDKFYGGEILEFLKEKGSQNIVVTGSATNVCVMYTATTAARHLPFEIYVPIDGVHADDPYRTEFGLFQLSILPSAPKPVKFTTLDGITFS